MATANMASMNSTAIATVTSSFLDTETFLPSPSFTTASPTTQNIQSTLSPHTTPSLPSSAADHIRSTISPTLVQRDTTAWPSFTPTWNASLLFDGVRDTFHSSTSGGGESPFNGSSASLSPSSTVFDRTLDIWTSDGLESSERSLGMLSEGETISATPLVDNVQATVLPTSSSSESFGNSASITTMPTTLGNGDVMPSSNGGQEDSLSDALIIFIPVGVTVLIVIVILIIVCIVCCRRKKKKEEVKAGPDVCDLWVDPDSQQVPATPLTMLSAPDSEPPSSAAATSASTETEQLYKVVYEFPGQLDSQLTLAPGDLVEVVEEADNGWLRGVIKGDNRSGWFPSSFVVPVNTKEASPTAATPDEESSAAGLVPEEASQGGRPRISSFLIRKKPSKRLLQLANVPRLTAMHNQNSMNKKSRSAIAVAPVSPVKIADSNPLTAEDFSTSVKDKYFKALFPYKAAYRGELTLREGEIIAGLEKDRNGWMLGRKMNPPGDEGWFPAVYVDQVKGDLSATNPTGHEEDRVTSSPLQRDVYSVLDANRTKSPDQAWVAIEHRVIRDFAAQSENHMWLHAGDVVAVVHVLQCGWCLGCHGDRLGWFPADHVELMEERSEGKMDSFSMLPLCRDPHGPPRHDTSASTTLDSRDHLDPHRPSPTLDVSQDSILSEGGGDRHRPARRAPRAPLLSATPGLQGSVGNLSTASGQSLNPRPARPAPAPPSARKPRSDSVDSMDRLESSGQPGRSAAMQQKKQRKPRVVRLPKERLGLDKLSSFPGPLPKSPSVESCGSPRVMPTSRDTNLFFVKTDSGSDQHVQPSEQRSVDDRDTKVTENITQNTEQVAGHFPAEAKPCGPQIGDQMEMGDAGAQSEQNGQNGVEGTDTQTAQDQSADAPNSDLHRDQKDRGDVKHTGMQTSQDHADVQGPGRETRERTPSSPTATSIAVQTDSDVNEDLNHLLSNSKNVELTSAPPTERGEASSTAGSRSGDNVGSGRTSEKSTSPDIEESPKMNSEENKHGQTPAENSSSDSDSDQDAGATELRSNPLSETTGDVRNGPSSGDTDPPGLAPKPTSPLPDLLRGANISPEPSSEPRPASPVLSDSKPKLRSSSHMPRPKEADVNPKPVKLNPVVRPVSQRDVDNDEQEGPFIPPEGVPGRVSKIVHHINRMASVEERHQLPRKSSLPNSSPHHVDEAAERGLHSFQTTPASDSTEGAASPPSSPGRQTEGLPPHETRNGDQSRSGLGGSDHPNGLDQTDPSSTSSSVEPRYLAEDGSSPGPDSQGTPTERISWIRRSRGEGQTRRQSGKGSRVAPPPPTSPPPPLIRKSQKMRMSREAPSEC